MIELAEGLWIDPFSVTMVKRISENRCVLFTRGQPGTDGHVLDYGAEEVVEAIEDALNEVEEDGEDVEDED